MVAAHGMRRWVAAAAAVALLCVAAAAPPPETDADGDGIADGADVCVTVPDRLQLDEDGDGTGDACQECPPGWHGTLAEGVRVRFDRSLGRYLADRCVPKGEDNCERPPDAHFDGTSYWEFDATGTNLHACDSGNLAMMPPDGESSVYGSLSGL